jgi:hypothetical protein
MKEQTLAQRALFLLLALLLTGCAGGAGSGGGTTASAGVALTIVTEGPFKSIFGVPFSLTLEATGGTGGPRTWSVTAGALPVGLTLDPATGVLSGTPTGFPFSPTATVRVSDGQFATIKVFSFVLAAKVEILEELPQFVPRPHVGVGYQKVMRVSHATGQVRWRIVSGQPPPGLSLQQQPGNGSVAVAGMPSAPGVFSFTLEAQDDFPQTATFDLTLDVDGSLLMTIAELVPARQHKPYSESFAAVGGQPPYHWSLANLPEGLTVDPSTGQVTGTPTAVGSTTYTVTVQDSSTPPQIDSRDRTLQVVRQLQIVDNPLRVHLNLDHCQTFALNSSVRIDTTGGNQPHLRIVAGALPVGLTYLDRGGSGFICGISNQIGNFLLTFEASDTGPYSEVVTRALTLTMDDSVFITHATLGQGWQNQFYVGAGSLHAINGVPPYQWSATGFPDGLTLDPVTGQVAGIPTVAGLFAFSATVTDASNPPETHTKQGTIFVGNELKITNPPGDPFLGRPYGGRIHTTGGQFRYTWRLVSGQLPPGMFMSPDGLAGTPTQLGTYLFAAEVRDSSPGPYIVQGDFSLTVVAAPFKVFKHPLSPVVRGAPYHSSIELVGGVPPYLWSVSAGEFPPGLALNPATGEIGGTPTQPGTFVFDTTNLDSSSSSQTVSGRHTIVIQPARGRNDSIQTATPLGNGLTDVSLSPYVSPITSSNPNPDQDYYRLLSAGGSIVRVESTTSFSFAFRIMDTVLQLLDGNGQRLQSCVAPQFTSPCLNDDRGIGIRDSLLDLRVPGPPGTQTPFYAHVLDWRGQARPDMRYAMSVGGVTQPLSFSPASLGLGATLGVAYQKQFFPAGGTGAINFSLASGMLPPGWSLTANGLLTGTATATGIHTFTVQAVDSATPPQTAQRQFTLQIAEPLRITTPIDSLEICAFKSFAIPLETTGGLPPFRWSISAPRWQAGVDLDINTGVLSGYGPIPDTITALVTVSDSADPSSGDHGQLTLNILNCP